MLPLNQLQLSLPKTPQREKQKKVLLTLLTIESADKDLRASFLKKVNLAKQSYDYTDETKDTKQKQERLTAINELIQYLSDQRMVTNYFITNIESVMDMIKKNIFRPLPSTNRNNVALGVSETGVEEEEQEPDPSWVHIRGIYEIFLQLIRKSTIKV